MSDKFWLEIANAPYSYSKEECDKLPAAHPIEIDLWIKNHRFKAIKTYQQRTNIKDLKLISWMFFSNSMMIENLKQEAEKLRELILKM